MTLIHINNIFDMNISFNKLTYLQLFHNFIQCNESFFQMAIE